MTAEQLTHLLSALGPTGIACTLFVMGRLSARMHETTRGTPAYLAFYVGALLLAVSAAARLIGVGQGEALEQAWLWVMLYDGLPIIGIGISLVAAWHVWAWLLAERD